jgi:hypothetical protein
MSKINIDNTRRKVQEKLAQYLAGPFATYLPKSWFQEIIKELGYTFREVAFSPLDYDLGLYWTSP